MILTAKNMRELLLFNIAIKGEAKREWLLEEAGNREYASKVLKDMLDDKVIKKARSKDERVNQKDNILRLTSPKGVDELTAASPLARVIYDKVTTKHKFGGSVQSEKRRQRQAELIHHMQMAGAPIDDIKIEVQSNIFGRGEYDGPRKEVTGLSGRSLSEKVEIYANGREPVPLSSVVSNSEQDTAPHYYTSKITRTLIEKDGAQDKTPLAMSILYGSYLLNGVLYPCYCAYEAGSRWKRDNERFVRDIFKSRSPVIKSLDDVESAALFFSPDGSETIKLLPSSEEKGSRSMRPWDVYQHAYVIDYSKMYMLKILQVKNAREKIVKELFGSDASPVNKYIDHRQGGIDVYEFITCDLAKMHYAKKAGKPCFIVTSEKDEEVIKEYFEKEKAKIITMSEDEIRDIFGSIF